MIIVFLISTAFAIECFIFFSLHIYIYLCTTLYEWENKFECRVLFSGFFPLSLSSLNYIHFWDLVSKHSDALLIYPFMHFIYNSSSFGCHLTIYFYSENLNLFAFFFHYAALDYVYLLFSVLHDHNDDGDLLCVGYSFCFSSLNSSYFISRPVRASWKTHWIRFLHRCYLLLFISFSCFLLCLFS